IGPRHPRFHLPLPHAFRSFDAVDLKLLKQAAIFQDLDDGELARVAEVCREQKFAVGQHVFKEGEPGNRLFIISEGEVRISRTIPGSGEEALAVLKPGASFGEMAIFDRSERSTDAIANTSCTLLAISEFLAARPLDRLTTAVVVQPEPRGLGDAITCARAVVGTDHVAVMLPDNLFRASYPMRPVLDAHRRTGRPVVLLAEIHARDAATK